LRLSSPHCCFAGDALTLGLAPGGEPIQFRGVWFAAHVVLAFAAYSGLALAFAAGLLYLLQFGRSGQELRAGLPLLPPLETLDRLRQGALWIGLPALTFALLLGWAWTVRFRNSLATQNPPGHLGRRYLVRVHSSAGRAPGEGGAERRAAFVVGGFAVVVVTYMLLRILMADGRAFL
jgi:hypothetical protein